MGAPGRFGAVFFGSLRGYRRTWLWAHGRFKIDKMVERVASARG